MTPPPHYCDMYWLHWITVGLDDVTVLVQLTQPHLFFTSNFTLLSCSDSWKRLGLNVIFC